MNTAKPAGAGNVQEMDAKYSLSAGAEQSVANAATSDWKADAVSNMLGGKKFQTRFVKNASIASCA